MPSFLLPPRSDTSHLELAQSHDEGKIHKTEARSFETALDRTHAAQWCPYASTPDVINDLPR